MATTHILRAQLRSAPANGAAAFVPSIRKLVVEYCQHLPSSTNTRTFLRTGVEQLARENPHVEFVVKQRNGHEPIARGFYANGLDKVVPLNGFEVNGIQVKLQLLLDASGNRIRHLKKSHVVESTTEAARGIWSGLHVDTPFKI